MKKLEGKIAIVTGSGRGIGQAIALKLAREGAKVVVNDLDAGPAEETIAKIRALGSDAISCLGDVTAPDFGTRIVKATLDAFGGIDIIVNNAGYAWDGVIQKMTDEQWYAMLDVHATAPFRILRAASDFIRSRGEEGEGGRPQRQPQGGEHLVHRRHVRQCRPDGLFCRQGRHRRHDQDHGQGMGPLPGERQLRRVRADPDAHDPAGRLGRGGGENRRTRSENGHSAGVHRVHEPDDPARPRRHAGGGGRARST